MSFASFFRTAGDEKLEGETGNEAICAVYTCMCIYIALCITGIFYCTLGNISPEHRSSTKAIQLLTVVKLRSYGIDKVLQPFMDDIHALEEVNSVDYYVHV